MCFIYNLMPFIPSFLAGKIFLKCNGVRRLSQGNLMIGNWFLDESWFPVSLDESQLKQGCLFMMISGQNTATISDVGKRKEATCGDSIQQRAKQLEDWKGADEVGSLQKQLVQPLWEENVCFCCPCSLIFLKQRVAFPNFESAAYFRSWERTYRSENL